MSLSLFLGFLFLVSRAFDGVRPTKFVYGSLPLSRGKLWNAYIFWTHKLKIPTAVHSKISKHAVSTSSLVLKALYHTVKRKSLLASHQCRYNSRPSLKKCKQVYDVILQKFLSAIFPFSLIPSSFIHSFFVGQIRCGSDRTFCKSLWSFFSERSKKYLVLIYFSTYLSIKCKIWNIFNS